MEVIFGYGSLVLVAALMLWVIIRQNIASGRDCHPSGRSRALPMRVAPARD